MREKINKLVSLVCLHACKKHQENWLQVLLQVRPCNPNLEINTIYSTGHTAEKTHVFTFKNTD